VIDPSVKTWYVAAMKVLLALVAIAIIAALPAKAEDWKTTDGKVYKDVQVIKVEDDAVTILFAEGGARVDLAKLSPELQKKFSYDPVKAKVAADARAHADSENSKQLQAEIEQADKMKLDHQIALEKQNQEIARQAAEAAAAASTNTITTSTPPTIINVAPKGG
jgi:hypothetical protein